MNYKEIKRIQKLINGIKDNSMNMSEVTLNGDMNESTVVMFLVSLNQDIKEIKEIVDTQVKRNNF